MKCITFVTKKFKSADAFTRYDYSNFGSIVQEIEFDPLEKLRWYRGIRVVPLSDNMGFISYSLITSDKCIILEVNEEDIIFRTNDGTKIQASQVTPLYELTRDKEEWHYVMSNPEFAFLYAAYIDRKSNEDTRAAALKHPRWATQYALYVDHGAHNDTRQSALLSPLWSKVYALEVDKKSLSATRKATLNDPEAAFNYALYVDRCARLDTRKACLADPEWAYRYAMEVDKCARSDTRKSACSSVSYALRAGKPTALAVG
jgi:hypothetical protein